ncbi:hypothetical protein DRE_06443 [Drechslerella stenobrocha 248]|uniref:F-box domain-containing protein n=1 Tax=Drechslerella stenobrocha 248 TaxID=1043628 RepID=W7I752_9PEZI|nr:hypothetical protein DRE_06443 [Drechslerella stenobrocha 248]
MVLLLDLSTELLVEILGYLTTYTELRHACLVCRRFQSLTVPLLYRTVVLRGHTKHKIDPRDSAAFLKTRNPWVRFIRYFGVETLSCGLPCWDDQITGTFGPTVDDITLRFLQLLERDQLRGLIICDGIVIGEAILRHLESHQQRIEAIYESKGIRTNHMWFHDPLRREIEHRGPIKRFLCGASGAPRTGLTDITVSDFYLEDMPFLHRVLEANQTTLRAVELDMNVLCVPGIARQITAEMTDAGCKLDVPFKLTALRKLSIHHTSDLSNDLVKLFTGVIIDYSKLTFLKLHNCVGETLAFWESYPRGALRLKCLWVMDNYTAEPGVVNGLLLSFEGLVQLVLDFLHEPELLRSGVVNHAGTLQKLYWRTTSIRRVDGGHVSRPGCGLSDDSLDFRSFVRLVELGACISEKVNLQATGRFRPPPYLQALYVLPANPPSSSWLFYPTREGVEEICRIVAPPSPSGAPFKYLLMGFRQPFCQWPLVLELSVRGDSDVEARPQPCFLRTDQYLFREVGESELVEAHPKLGFAMEMEDWVPWDIR